MATGYHINLHGQTSRSSGRRSTFMFGAVDVGHANAVAVELGNWTADQVTTITQNIFSAYRAINANYPTGTNRGFTAVVWDSTEGAWRVRLRNTLQQVDMQGCLEALLTGQGYTSIPGGQVLTALGAPPILPNSGNAVAYVTSLNTNLKP